MPFLPWVMVIQSMLSDYKHDLETEPSPRSTHFANASSSATNPTNISSIEHYMPWATHSSKEKSYNFDN